ncbi:MAG: hypothetical protein ACKVU1_18655 [bacterium]
MICPLCQHRFNEDEMPCNTGCPMHRMCKVLCCPRCHYEFVEESVIVNFVKKLVGKRPAKVGQAR